MTHTLPILKESAIARLQHLLEKEPEGAHFRIAVKAGGCYGLQYSFGFDQEVKPEDQTFVVARIPLVIDETSLPFLEGLEVEYVDEMIGSYFKFNNPNAASGCGCGSSFSI